MRALKLFAAALLVGGALGVFARLVATGDTRRGMTALVAAFGAAACFGAAWNAAGETSVARLREGALLVAAAFVAAWTAAAVSGNASLVASPLVVAGAAAAACGAASLLRARGVGPAHAVVVGAAVPVAAAALLFVADPLVEWRGSETADAPDRARLVLAVDPIASIGDDVGLDWQRSTWLYVGPTAAAGPLSVVGRYYPSRPTSAWTWAAAAAALGFAALAAARRRGSLSA